MKTRFKNSNEYYEHFSRLVEIERKEEMKLHLQEMKKLSGEERERKGRALTELKARFEGTLLFKFVYSFRKVGKNKLPENEIKVGDVVLVSKTHPLKDGKEGVVIEKTKYSMSVVFDERLPPSWRKAKLRIDLYCNDTTFQRMKSALLKVKDGNMEFSMPILLGMKNARINVGEEEKIAYFNKKLNPSQREAVARALITEPLFLIHGPPGTGKTTTCVEIIKQLVARGKKVLVCADSNVAVDNIVEKIADKVYVVRIGHPARISKKLHETCIDHIIACSEEGMLIEELTRRIEKLKEKRDVLTKPTQSKRRGLSDAEILKLARKSKGKRGLSQKEIKEMALWITHTSSIRALAKKREELFEKAARKVIRNAQVVCTTNAGSYAEIMQDERFDVVVVDEATQATEPSCLMPLTKAPKVIMAGDHKQLPPTIMNEEAKEKGLGVTMFERFMQLYGKKASIMLEYQYRMHPLLVEFPNRKFYGGKLKSDKSVLDMSVQEIIKKKVKVKDKLDKACFSPIPLVWIDIRHVHGRERRRAESTSLENITEALMVKKLVEKLLGAGVKASQTGVITPYKDQKELISRMVSNDVEVNTVDGFQGREKEVIILSLVRSNEEKRIGFLKDKRRLNVAITRARRKLIVVSDSKTVAAYPLYREFLRFVKNKALYLEIKGGEFSRICEGKHV